jgi:hypothetical protein
MKDNTAISAVDGWNGSKIRVGMVNLPEYKTTDLWFANGTCQ